MGLYGDCGLAYGTRDVYRDKRKRPDKFIFLGLLASYMF